METVKRPSYLEPLGTAFQVGATVGAAVAANRAFGASSRFMAGGVTALVAIASRGFWNSYVSGKPHSVFQRESQLNVLEGVVGLLVGFGRHAILVGALLAVASEAVRQIWVFGRRDVSAIARSAALAGGLGLGFGLLFHRMGIAVGRLRQVSTGDGRWWRPWDLPNEVDSSVRRAFEGSGTLEERTREATRRLLTWRLNQIVDPAERERALQCLEDSFTHCTMGGRRIANQADCDAALEDLFSIFPPQIRSSVPRTVGGFKRSVRLARGRFEGRSAALPLRALLREVRRAQSELMSLRQSQRLFLGAYFPGQDLWLDPTLRITPSQIGLFHIQSHEIGGHLAAACGVSGPAGVLSHSLNNRLALLFDPLRPFTLRAGLFAGEGYGIGAEWELLSRMPRQVREELLGMVRQSMGGHEDLLQPRFWFGRWHREFRRRFTDPADQKRYGILVHLHQALLFAQDRKGSFIRAGRRNLSYDAFGFLWTKLVKEYKFLREEGVPGVFWAQRVFDAAKLGGASWLAYEFAQEIRRDREEWLRTADQRIAS